MKKVGLLLATAALILTTLTACPPGGMNPPTQPGDREYALLVFVRHKVGTDSVDRHIGMVAHVNVVLSDGRPFISPFNDSRTTPWVFHISVPAEFSGILSITSSATWPQITRFGEVGDVFGCELTSPAGRTVKANSRQVGNASVDSLTVHCDIDLPLAAVA